MGRLAPARGPGGTSDAGDGEMWEGVGGEGNGWARLRMDELGMPPGVDEHDQRIHGFIRPSSPDCRVSPGLACSLQRRRIHRLSGPWRTLAEAG